MTLILEPGVYSMPMAEYLADPCVEPSLSASIAHILLTKSPRHAWTAHPRLNPDYVPNSDDAFDLGTAAHAYLLEGGGAFTLIPFPDYRTKASRDLREAARAAGRLPLLAEKWTDVQGMATAASQQLAAHPAPAPFVDGDPEQVLVWREGATWCRARLDWLHHSRRAFDDYKTTSGSAHPDVWTRGPLFQHGFDLQAAFYRRGLEVVCGRLAEPRFVVQETAPPYALSVIGLGPDVLTLAEKKRLRALELWEACREAGGLWPAYPPQTCYAVLPPWEEARWMEREEREVRDEERRQLRDGRPDS